MATRTEAIRRLAREYADTAFDRCDPDRRGTEPQYWHFGQGDEYDIEDRLGRLSQDDWSVAIPACRARIAVRQGEG